MRVSGLYNANMMTYQMGKNGTQMNKLMQQMSTLQRVNVPSDDPIASSRMVQLNREQSAITQYQSNISRLSGNLSMQESHVTALNNQLTSLNDKLLAASNDTHSSEDMSGFGKEISSMLDSLVATLNSKNEDGRYLFSGTKTDQKPVVWNETTQSYEYNGNDGTRETAVANGVSITENTNLSGAFSSSGNDLDLLNQLKSISEKMQDPNIPASDYADELNALMGAVKDSSDDVAAIFTDLGGRQNRLTMLDDAHTDVKTANDMVAKDLSGLDMATASVNFQLYYNSMQVSNKTYSMISQLSLFSMM